MTTNEQIETYLASHPASKQHDLRTLHALLLELTPAAPPRFLSGRNEAGKVVANPNIGYGSRVIRYAGGDTREFYRIGLSANTGGISVYLLGLADKERLARLAAGLGKATVTGYCIKFRKLTDIDLAVLKAAIVEVLALPSA